MAWDAFALILAMLGLGMALGRTTLLPANGLPVPPPAGWRPDDPRLRGLVVEGREPIDPT